MAPWTKKIRVTSPSRRQRIRLGSVFGWRQQCPGKAVFQFRAGVTVTVVSVGLRVSRGGGRGSAGGRCRGRGPGPLRPVPRPAGAEAGLDRPPPAGVTVTQSHGRHGDRRAPAAELPPRPGRGPGRSKSASEQRGSPLSVSESVLGPGRRRSTGPGPPREYRARAAP